jgi:hypothetical protein
VIVSFAGQWQGLVRIMDCEQIAMSGFRDNTVACVNLPGSTSNVELNLTQSDRQSFGLLAFGSDLQWRGSVTGTVAEGAQGVLTLQQENTPWVRQDVLSGLTVPTTTRVTLESFRATVNGSQLNAEYVVRIKRDTPADPVARFVANSVEYRLNYRTEVVTR